jgi:NAD(P)-dependent dehydrogenase (short-subunit alcohol dehydrogenase family)
VDDLRDKVAVITGGASGIGLATAKCLGHEGMRVVLADVEQDPLGRAERELTEIGIECIGVPTDVRKLEDVERLAEITWATFGGCHVLFNNAGVAVAGPMAQMTHNDWKWVIDVNLWGPIHGIEVFVPRMIEQGEGGHILSTASFAGLVANDGLGVYCVSKYGVVAMMECLYRELSPYDIGVSVLCPMRVETNINESQRNRPAELGGGSEGLPPGSGDEEGRAQAGPVVSVDEVTPMILRAIKEKRLYILTHPESRGFIASRFRRIDRAFED